MSFNFPFNAPSAPMPLAYCSEAHLHTLLLEAKPILIALCPKLRAGRKGEITLHLDGLFSRLENRALIAHTFGLEVSQIKSTIKLKLNLVAWNFVKRSSK